MAVWNVAYRSIAAPAVQRALGTLAPKASRLPADGKTLADFMPVGSAGGCGGARAAEGISPPADSSHTGVVVQRKPPWLKMVNPNLTVEGAAKYQTVKATINKTGLSTVCQEARCPNAGECWSGGTATVMIMGDTCTRGCRFCAVATSRSPPPLDPSEPEKVAAAVKEWGIDYIVLTMVDRDDLPDQGAGHIARTIREVKEKAGVRVETLVGDFQGNLDLVGQVALSGMDVFAHNIETVERLQRTVRDRRANYAQSLSVLRHAKLIRPDVVTKSSIMLGLGEEREDILQTLHDLRENKVDIVTFGQYLQPTKWHMKVTRYVTPQEFDELRVTSESLGFHSASGPLVRSSYKAGDLFKARLARRAMASVTSASASTPQAGGPRELGLPLCGESLATRATL